VEDYKIEGLTFAYANSRRTVLDGISLTVERGEFVTLCGPSGCGKTTLLRHLKPSAAPHGTRSGRIYFEGTPPEEVTAKDAAAKIGFVMQSPENQIVTDKVWHELAFGLESLGLRTPEIRLRVAETASFFGIQTWFHRPVALLSGGQQQILALASVMVMQPRVLILDEPTSRLDPIAAGEFLAMLGKINRELGVTVILTEHRPEEAFPLSSRAVVMDGGRIVADGTPRDVGLALRSRGHGMFAAMPAPMRIWAASPGNDDTCPVTVRDGAAWLARQPLDAGKLPPAPGEHAPETNVAIALEEVWFRYDKNLPDVLKGLSFKASYGRITAILGGNSTGKTTALSVIAGLNTPLRGKVRADAAVYVLPQNPQTLFVAGTVRQDMLEILSGRNLSKDEEEARLDNAARLCRLEGLLESHPHDLSGGEQQRAALAKLLLLQPKILLLDEPTKGLDAEYKKIFAAILRGLAKDGAAVVMVSHDVEFCAEYADRCALFFDGSIAAEGTPREFFSGNSFYTTGANRMARWVLPAIVTVGDALAVLGAEPPPPPELPAAAANIRADKSDFPPAPQVSAPYPQQNKPPRHVVAASAAILAAIPFTIYAGIYFLGDRWFGLISVLIILQAMLPVALMFEGRKPRARELVVLALLCAIAVAGRAAFFMLPQFKPVVAMVIISGVAFGGQAGFLVGAMTAFAGNMIFGQGPWTPWQMFALGVIGLLAGALSGKGLLRRTPVPLALFGGLATFIVYGGIMNPAGVLIFQPSPTPEMFLLAYIQAIPFDLIHAAATVTFLLLISRPMLEKLDRIKTKYGLANR